MVMITLLYSFYSYSSLVCNVLYIVIVVWRCEIIRIMHTTKYGWRVPINFLPMYYYQYHEGYRFSWRCNFTFPVIYFYSCGYSSCSNMQMLVLQYCNFMPFSYYTVGFSIPYYYGCGGRVLAN